jgi:hypothetical protein
LHAVALWVADDHWLWRWVADEQFAVGGFDGEGGGGVELEVPAVLVDQVVVSSAERDEVVELGGAAVWPVPDVVGLAPGRWPVAAGVAAAFVADGE